MRLTNYWWLLIWMFTGGAALTVLFPRRKELVLGKWEERWGILPAVLLVLPYIIWAGYRGYIGDTYVYTLSYLKSPTSFGQIPTYITTIGKDKGFYILTAILHCVFGNNTTIYFFAIAAFQILIIAMVCRKYTRNYWLSIFIFIASTDYISWVMNGMRQFTAVMVIFAATGLIVRKEYLKAAACILLASTFHQSALLMLPIIFVIQGKPWNKKTLLVLTASIAALVFAGQFTNVMDSALANTQYTNVVSDWKLGNDDGTNPLRILVYAMPTILALVGRRKIQYESNNLINVCINASIVSTCLGLIAIGTSGIFIGRLPIYVSTMANWILLPWEIDHVFDKSTSKLVLIVAVICYSIFFYYQMHIAWGMI